MLHEAKPPAHIGAFNLADHDIQVAFLVFRPTSYVRTIQADEVLVTCRMMRILNWGQMRRVDSSTGLLCQFHESGSEIRMRVGVENRFDTGASLVGKLEIIVYIAFGIDDGSFAAMDDEIGRMGQPIDKKTFNV